MFGLKYYKGAQPGKAKSTTGQKRQEQMKIYEKTKRKRSFNPNWLQTYEWLKYDEEAGSMTCSWCIEFYGITPTTSKQTLKLKGQGTFLTGSANLRHSAIQDHDKSNCI